MTDITFASYGAPTGDCDSGLSLGDCAATGFPAFVQSKCMGSPNCTVQCCECAVGSPNCTVQCCECAVRVCAVVHCECDTAAGQLSSTVPRTTPAIPS